MPKKDEEFREFLERMRDRQEAFLAATGSLDKESLEEATSVVPGVYEALGVVYRYFGDLKKSGKLFQKAANSYYPYKTKLPEPDDSKEPERRFTVAYQQAFGGISAGLGGDKKRAERLFKWAAENLRPEEDASSGATSTAGMEDSLALGGFFILRGYCLLRAGMHKRALEVLHGAEKVLSDRGRAATLEESDRHLPAALIPLCEYKMGGDEKKKEAAKRALEGYENALKENRERRKGYLYIYDLKDGFPEVYG